MKIELLIKWTLLNFAYQDFVEAMKDRKLLLTEIQDLIGRMDKEREKIEPQLSSEKAQGKIDVPDHLKRWVADDKLRHILRIDTSRKDTGFSKDDINLYLLMCEFSLKTVTVALSFSYEIQAAIGKMVRIPKGEFLYGDKKEY